MQWRILRMVIVASAFWVGMLVAGYQNSEASATGTAATADLSSTSGTSLVVTCEGGEPTVAHVNGLSTALEVKCAKSQMHVTRLGPAFRQDPMGGHDRLIVPSGVSPLVKIQKKDPPAGRVSS